MSLLLYLLFTHNLSWSLTNWSNWENTTIDNIKNQFSITILTEKNCHACSNYLKEMISCEIIRNSKVAIVAAGDDGYLRKIKSEIPNSVTLFKTTRKELSRITNLTPSTVINQKVINGFQNCNVITREAHHE